MFLSRSKISKGIITKSNQVIKSKIILNKLNISKQLFHSTSSTFDNVGINLDGRFDTHNVDGLPAETTATKEQLLEYYETMYTMRRMEVNI